MGVGPVVKSGTKEGFPPTQMDLSMGILRSSNPKETGLAGGSSQALRKACRMEGSSGPQRLGHCLWLQPSLEALPAEVQPSSERVAEWTQLDLHGPSATTH